MMFAAMAFVGLVLVGAPLSGLFFLALSLLFLKLHRRRAAAPGGGTARKWRRALAAVCGVLAGLNLLAGAAGWVFYLLART